MKLLSLCSRRQQNINRAAFFDFPTNTLFSPLYSASLEVEPVESEEGLSEEGSVVSMKEPLRQDKVGKRGEGGRGLADGSDAGEEVNVLCRCVVSVSPFVDIIVAFEMQILTNSASYPLQSTLQFHGALGPIFLFISGISLRRRSKEQKKLWVFCPRLGEVREGPRSFCGWRGVHNF